MGKVFLISDLHLFHSKILIYESRPFESIEIMHEKIVTNWNNTINKDDKIFILGDISFGNKEMTSNIIKKLKGNKTLIKGNHDSSRCTNFWLDVGFKEVYRYPIIYNMHFLLSHEPLISVPGGYLNVHGHTHSKCLNSQYHYNVSCEVLNYTPINFNVIRDQFYKEN